MSSDLSELFPTLSEQEKVRIKVNVDRFLKDGKLSDGEMNFLNEEAESLGIDPLELQKYAEKRLSDYKHLDNRIDLYLENGVLSKEERNALIAEAESLEIDIDEFKSKLKQKERKSKQALDDISDTPNDVASDFAGMEQRNDANSTRKSKSSSKNNSVFSILFPIIITAALIVVAVHLLKDNEPVPQPLDSYVGEHPSLVFKTAAFRKYLVLGTPDGTNEHFFKQEVFQVKASGDYIFDLTKLVKDKKQSSEKDGILVLSYSSDTYFPISIDVDIRQEDIVQIDNVEPKPVSEEEAKKIAAGLSKLSSLPAAAAGTWIGGKLGESFGIEGKLLGGSLGGVAAGAIVGGMTYVMTKKFFTGLQLSPSISVQKTEEFLKASKQIMQGELLTLNMSEKEDLESLRHKYEEEIRLQIQDLGTSLGWKKVVINFYYK